MPGPFDGLIPTPKEVGDWLEEVFGKGTDPNGPEVEDTDLLGGKKENDDRGKRRPGGPSVEDLYPK